MALKKVMFWSRKIKIIPIDNLEVDEQEALLKMIDLVIFNKRMSDNLQQLISQ